MTLTQIIYVVASAACSLFLLSRNLEAGGRWSVLLLYWLFVCAVPLLFVFAYPRFLFADSTPQKHRKYAAVLHGLGAVTATVLFPILTVPFWKNPVRDLGESISVTLVLLSVLVLFLIVAVLLLLKNRSSLVIFASLLFWPYWFLLALANTGHFFEATPLEAVFYFLCFLSAVLFAFAAGTISYRPTFAHVAAVAGLMSAPWIYSNAMTDSGLGNIWVVFNTPDNDPGAYLLRPYAQVAIAIVGLIALALVTAGLRLLPANWQFRGTPLRERTWPAVGASIVVLAVWFSQSVLPYRIPGAVDYSDYPVLQVLHVEKRGFQFHERCFSVYWQHPYRPVSVSFTGSDRQLFQYRFQHNGSRVQPPKAVVERIQAMVESPHEQRQQDVVRPIWNWNADRWYFSGQGFGLRVYGASNGSDPPQEVVDLFRELDRAPRYSETHSELKDVCLGFCYDPLSAMGWLYSNHRCFNDGHGLVCR